MTTATSSTLLKWFSPTGCLLALLGFFLVFTDLNCNGKTLDSITGFELVRGYKPDLDIVADQADEQPNETERYRPNVFALNAMISAIFGILLFLMRAMRKQYLTQSLITGIGFFSQVALMINLKSGLKNAISDKDSIINTNFELTFDMQAGYWIVLILLGLVTMSNILLYFDERNKPKPEEIFIEYDA